MLRTGSAKHTKDRSQKEKGALATTGLIRFPPTPFSAFERRPDPSLFPFAFFLHQGEPSVFYSVFVFAAMTTLPRAWREASGRVLPSLPPPASSVPHADTVRVASFNVLADGLAQSGKGDQVTPQVSSLAALGLRCLSGVGTHAAVVLSCLPVPLSIAR